MVSPVTGYTWRGMLVKLFLGRLACDSRQARIFPPVKKGETGLVERTLGVYRRPLEGIVVVCRLTLLLKLGEAWGDVFELETRGWLFCDIAAQDPVQNIHPLVEEAGLRGLREEHQEMEKSVIYRERARRRFACIGGLG